jgi:DNA-binding NarL/FixJ family response regulator
MRCAMKVLIVDDHPLLREALREHVRQLAQGVEVFEARTSKEALALATLHGPLDLALLDLNLPDAHGFSALTTLRDQHPELPVVVLSAQDDRATVFAALDHGAMGFVPKTAATPVLLSALRLVLSGGTYLPAVILDLHNTAGQRPAPPAIEHLSPVRTPAELGMTPRQAQVLTLVVQGKPNKLICRELGLAESTVKIHITSILRALNVSNRVQAVIAVARLGLQLETMGAGFKPATAMQPTPREQGRSPTGPRTG